MCPTFLLGIAGPWLSVHGGLLLGRDWVVQPLTDYIWVGSVPDILLDRQIARVANLFDLLKNSLKDLKGQYEVWARSKQVQLPFPYVSPFNTRGTAVQLTYKERIHYSAKTRSSTAMFRAECNIDGSQTATKVFVKFTSRYNQEAHELLADQGYAPKLLACEKIDFGFMVVMAWVDGTSVTDRPLSEEDLTRVQDAKSILHKHDYVFGDLRPNNIIKPTNGDGVLLVDFDWANKEGKGRYPLAINSSIECGWHPKVKAGALMLKRHDDHLFDRLRSV